MNRVVLVLDNVRSSHNVGSILRTCDGLGVESVYLCGITPRPTGAPNDERLPHIAAKANKDIHKTALGAETSVQWHYFQTTELALQHLKENGWYICAIEQDDTSIPLQQIPKDKNIALVVGTEVTGIETSILQLCDQIVEIPMTGKKESFNVSIAAAIALYEMRR